MSLASLWPPRFFVGLAFHDKSKSKLGRPIPEDRPVDDDLESIGYVAKWKYVRFLIYVCPVTIYSSFSIQNSESLKIIEDMDREGRINGYRTHVAESNILSLCNVTKAVRDMSIAQSDRFIEFFSHRLTCWVPRIFISIWHIMFASRNIFVFLFTPFALSIPWDGPLNTPSPSINSNQEILDSEAPVPTTAPELVKRADYPIGFCRWLDGLYSYAPCAAFSACIWRTDVAAVGCCRDASNLNTCSMFTSCINYSDLGAASISKSDSLLLRC